MRIRVKRAYEPAENDDGYRVLVDRIWPRGIPKNSLRIDGWVKEIAPSNELRKWFGHDPAKWRDFKDRYSCELAEQSDAVEALKSRARVGTLTLVFGAKDSEHNNAVALKEYLESDIEK